MGKIRFFTSLKASFTLDYFIGDYQKIGYTKRTGVIYAMQSFSGNTIDFTSMTCTSRADSDIKIFTNNYISIAITRELFMPTSIV